MLCHEPILGDKSKLYIYSTEYFPSRNIILYYIINQNNNGHGKIIIQNHYDFSYCFKCYGYLGSNIHKEVKFKYPKTILLSLSEYFPKELIRLILQYYHIV